MPRLLSLQLPEIDPLDGAQQAQRTVADVQHPQRVTRRVIGDPMRKEGTHILGLQVIAQQLAQLQDARPERPDLAGQPRDRVPGCLGYLGADRGS